MTLTLPISHEVEARLAAKARAAGVDVATYITAVVEENAKAPMSIKEISGTTAEAFKASGMTEDELGDLLEEEKHAMRAERRAAASQQSR